MAKVTMRDVAQRAGVSSMTVSNVINDYPHVSESTRAKVLAAIAETGYKVNVTARSLRQGKTGVIGLAVPGVDQPYFGLLAFEVIRAAAAHGYDVVVEQTGAMRDEELRAVTTARLRSYDGLVMNAVRLGEDDTAFVGSEYPVVLLGERSYREGVDHVAMANEDGTQRATEHLFDQGCRALAMIGGRVGAPDDKDVGTLRALGFQDALLARGETFDPSVVRPCELSMAGGYTETRLLIAGGQPFDGLVCATDLVAFGAIRALRDAGVDVPGDVKVVGFDDIPMAGYATPSLTTVAPDHRWMAETAVGMVVGRIAGTRTLADGQEVVAPFELVVRESSTTAPERTRTREKNR